MELDVKLAPQCMEVGSAGLHTAAAASSSAGGVVKTSIMGQVGLCIVQVVWDIFVEKKRPFWKWKWKATLESESESGIFLNLSSLVV